ncbi:aminoglycoside phosphotransferase family protein [Myxococcota bacterium]|nr:aminoglycoside phosphotransferase family protein [Myxococcota bacterium]
MSAPLLTPEDLAARTRSAVTAAVEGARSLGLVASEPEVLHDAFSVIVRLGPEPVVARVPVALPVDLDLAAQSARQARELAVVAWLDARGAPVVRPSPLVPAAPLVRDGRSMTFWEYVDVDTAAKPDYLADARYAAELHAALEDCPVALPFLAPLNHTVPGCLGHLERCPELIAPADLERARTEWARLAPVLSSVEAFRRTFPGVPVQAVHGDAPAYNLIRTHTGHRFADFEDVTLGPVEWDLAGFGPDAAAHYDAAAAALGLRALDRRVLAVMDAARALQAVASLALTPQLPALPVWLAPWLEQWRSTPLAGGLAAPD